MPFALLIIGVVLLVAGVRATQDNLFTLVKGDFSGQGNFVYWFVAIMIVGALGYVPKLKPISVGLLTLIVLVLFLKKGDPLTGVGGGFFSQFTTGLGTTTKTATPDTPLSKQAQTVQDLRTQLLPYLNATGPTP